MELIDLMVAAPASEVKMAIPATVGECAKLLGIEVSAYSTVTHYPLLIAKARRQWAQRIIAEAQGEGY